MQIVRGSAERWRHNKEQKKKITDEKDHKHELPHLCSVLAGRAHKSLKTNLQQKV